MAFTLWIVNGKKTPNLLPVKIKLKINIDSNNCWLWSGAINKSGYSLITRKHKQIRLHRWVYEQFYNEIPQGLVIDHLCRVRHCVNPDHLEAVTLKENVLRGDAAKPRKFKKEYCIRGHKFDELNTLYQNYKGKIRRSCKICYNNRMREYMRNKKLERIVNG
jgi:hypothetical protein